MLPASQALPKHESNRRAWLGHDAERCGSNPHCV